MTKNWFPVTQTGNIDVAGWRAGIVKPTEQWSSISWLFSRRIIPSLVSGNRNSAAFGTKINGCGSPKPPVTAISHPGIIFFYKYLNWLKFELIIPAS